jgi:Luciferase-like monooxygenase
MRCSINIPNLGDFANPRVVGNVARLAEEAGWDGLFVWNHMIGYNRDWVSDFAATNILLTAAALATSRIKLGTQVTPVPRRRPRHLAKEIATLDQLSGGRMVLGAGARPAGTAPFSTLAMNGGSRPRSKSSPRCMRSSTPGGGGPTAKTSCSTWWSGDLHKAIRPRLVTSWDRSPTLALPGGTSAFPSVSWTNSI